MICVGQCAFGLWHWTMIDPAGRVLVYRSDFATEAAAIGDARAYRVAFFSIAAAVDHRQGACI